MKVQIIVFLLSIVLQSGINAQTIVFTDDSDMTLYKLDEGDFLPSRLGGLNDTSLKLGISYDLKLDLVAGKIFQCGGSELDADVNSVILSTSILDETTSPIITDSLKVVQGIDLDRENKELYFIDGVLDDPQRGRICKVDYNGNNQECIAEFDFKSSLSGGGCKLAVDVEENVIYYIRGGFNIHKVDMSTGVSEDLNIPDDTYLADIVLDKVNNRLVYLRGTPSTSYDLFQIDLSIPDIEEEKLSNIELQDAKSIFLYDDFNQIIVGKQSWVKGAFRFSNSGFNIGDLPSASNFATTELVIFNPDNIILFADEDGDGFTEDEDCDDTDPDINPAATEIANNGIDEDCDGMDLTTAVHELSASKISIYPNPANDVIYLDINDQLNYEANIYDLEGKAISTSTNTSRIMVKSLPSGTYFLEVKDLNSGEKILERIIIQN